MILRRKIYDYLLDWKANKDRKCLLIKGARQVGKSFIVEQFGKENYDSFIEINFIFHPELINAFSGSLAVDDITRALSLSLPEARFIPGRTLIFLDEIQQCPLARTALKSFAIDSRYDVIASGSLLGLHYGQDAEMKEPIPSIPVGYEHQVQMHSLDFEEFLWAKGISEDNISYLHGMLRKEEKIPEPINDHMMDLFRQYIVVGGMPNAVDSYITSNSFAAAHEAQEKILASYDDDISRHAKGTERLKIRKCWASIPQQLAKENRKFQYSKVEPKSTAKKYMGSIHWLEDAAVVNACINATRPEFPISAYSDETDFKLYANDIGLLIAMYGFDMKAAIINKTLTGPAKGGIYENAIADLLVKRGHRLYFFHETGNEQEIEFLITEGSSVIPIEVKSRNGATLSLNRFIERFSPKTAYKLVDGNIGRDGAKLTLPHYLAMFL